MTSSGCEMAGGFQENWSQVAECAFTSMRCGGEEAPFTAFPSQASLEAFTMTRAEGSEVPQSFLAITKKR